MPMLKYLRISNLPPDRFAPTMFSKMNLLESLILRRNQLESLPDAVFAPLTKLRHKLDLSHNRFETLPQHLLDPLFAFNGNLTLAHSLLTAVPVFSAMSQLSSLSLAFNGLRSIPSAAFDSLTAMQYCDLSSNQLFELSSDTFNQQHRLEQLRLANNALTALPGGCLSTSDAIEVTPS
eukprot:TRINITY_DN6408_c0_g1_i1.p2 TRINITY_DN6408_c0_g1~~TRINITY_DN6408_c0_g1_i1.p2  ORF type:complete len:178 (+),score=20.32 TRINITY_DN6408_c0_g1_i1:192-725(+)